MKRNEAIAEIPLSVFTAYELANEQYANDACEQIEKLINVIYDDNEKEKMQLKNQINYWKTSFNKQVEASRK